MADLRVSFICSILHKQRAFSLLALVVVVAALLAGTNGSPLVYAQGGDEDLPPGVTWDQVNEIASKMYCDVCEGVPLDECESITCANWRREIARLIGEGYTENEIVDYFVERYGEDVSAVPRDPTDRLIAFAVPVILFTIIGVIGVLQVRKFRQRGQQAGQAARRAAASVMERPVPTDLDPAILERLQRELEGLEL